MAVGDPAIWADHFRSLDVRFLQCVIAVWPRCLAVLPSQPKEDQITINLVSILLKDANARRLFYYIDYHYEPCGFTAEGTAYSKGEIDMAVLLDQDRERYLAYECKRLNVIHNGKKSSLATLYVKEGIVRFVNEQYAENLPIGCMLGYVLDGDVADAKSKIQAAIDVNKSLVALAVGPQDEQSLGIAERFSSRHRRAAVGQEIEIRHALLPFPKNLPKNSGALNHTGAVPSSNSDGQQ